MRTAASSELLSARDDVWAFVAEPHHLSHWWPGIAGVYPESPEVGMGIRWQVVGDREPTLFRRPESTGTVIVIAAEAPRTLAFRLLPDRLDVAVTLESTAPDRTRATVVVRGPLLLASRRTLARSAVERLYALCQTAAGP